MSTRIYTDTNTEPKNKTVFNGGSTAYPGDFSRSDFTAKDTLLGVGLLFAL